MTPTSVAVTSPQALLASRSHCVAGVPEPALQEGFPLQATGVPVVASGVAKVPVCPTVLNPRLRIFLAAFSSLSRTHPQAQICTFYQPNSLNLFWLIEVQVTSSLQLQLANPLFINEDN